MLQSRLVRFPANRWRLPRSSWPKGIWPIWPSEDVDHFRRRVSQGPRLRRRRHRRHRAIQMSSGLDRKAQGCDQLVVGRVPCPGQTIDELSSCASFADQIPGPVAVLVVVVVVYFDDHDADDGR